MSVVWKTCAVRKRQMDVCVIKEMKHVTSEATSGATGGRADFFQPNIRKEENNNKSLRLSFSSPGLYKQPIGHMTTESAAATSPTDGSECPWREILFVPAVLAGRVFQQDIPTEGEVNYEQTLHNRIWSWI